VERRRAAEELREEFLAAAPADRRGPRFDSPDLLELLLEESEAAQPADPESAELLAGWAERLAEALRGPHSLESDAQARAWRLRANARRLLGDPEGAEEALGCALNHLCAESGERPYFLAAWGLLRWDQARPEEAVAHFHEAAGLFLDAGAEPKEATCRLLAGLVAVENGDAGRGSIDLLKGWKASVAAWHPRLSLSAGFTFARLLGETGQHRHGREVFDEAMALYALVPEEGESLEAQRLEGAARSYLGEIGAAEELLQAVRLRQLDRGDLPALLLASLDLSVVLKKLGHGEHGVRLIGDLKGVRQGHGAGPAALRAAARFRRQCRMFDVPLRDPFPFA